METFPSFRHLIRSYVNVAPLLPSLSFIPALQGAPAPPVFSGKPRRQVQTDNPRPPPIRYLSFKLDETQLRFTSVLICVTGGCGVYPDSQWMRGIHPGKGHQSIPHTTHSHWQVQSLSEGAQKHICVVEDFPPQRFRSLILPKFLCEQPATR